MRWNMGRGGSAAYQMYAHAHRTRSTVAHCSLPPASTTAGQSWSVRHCTRMLCAPWDKVKFNRILRARVQFRVGAFVRMHLQAMHVQCRRVCMQFDFTFVNIFKRYIMEMIAAFCTRFLFSSSFRFVAFFSSHLQWDRRRSDAHTHTLTHRKLS